MPHRIAVILAAFFSLIILVQGHEHTLHQSTEAARAARARLAAQAEAPGEATGSVCHLTINLQDAESGQILPGLVRATNLDSGKFILLTEGVQRESFWYAVSEGAEVSVPPVRLRIEAFHGLETAETTVELDLSQAQKQEVNVKLNRFYDSRGQRLRSGNTHLHLRNLSRVEAERYLRVVAQADDLDLLFVSYLRRIPGEQTYISNSFTSQDLERLSEESVLLSNGEEHRHNFGAGGEGYGHVMFLNLPKLIEPVSIGPGIMGEGTDGLPLQEGIRAAREQQASVVWCHNSFGLEDIPNWIAGLIDAQNIFDGGSQGDYDDTFYRYLNAGLRVPFS
ncbi:MAG TPA: hypothetical protein VKZ59_02625, partial [Acidobacteriota bacterium]|nr:hypothetical protein [Acidobacteriota bacterium]